MCPELASVEPVARRQSLRKAGRWVVKIGSALLTNSGQGLDHRAIHAWVEQLAGLRQAGVEVVLVSSGAVAEGIKRLGYPGRPRRIAALQAAAAAGQMGLVQTYESAFQRFGLHTAQVLLTHDDLSDRQRYLNARDTLVELLRLGVVPVVNENDTVVTDEIRFGDNDTLAALVANLVGAEVMVLLTDQPGLFERDPRQDPQAELIATEWAAHPRLDAAAGGSAGALGRGGMVTKLRAARLAARSGCTTLIASGAEDNVIGRLHLGESIGTLLAPASDPVVARKQWLAGHLQLRGSLWLDAGAVNALAAAGRSLLPAGVTRVEGNFDRGEVVRCLDSTGVEVARGLVNYGGDEVRRIAGHNSERIEALLGYGGAPELIHRDNLVLTGRFMPDK
ncbi:MAG: glutamate 5-kinase [Pseudomonadota bacterium]|nr:glutamate 5-kinase [Pseudomonadota bacterium]